MSTEASDQERPTLTSFGFVTEDDEAEPSFKLGSLLAAVSTKVKSFAQGPPGSAGDVAPIPSPSSTNKSPIAARKASAMSAMSGMSGTEDESAASPKRVASATARSSAFASRRPLMPRPIAAAVPVASLTPVMSHRTNNSVSFARSPVLSTEPSYSPDQASFEVPPSPRSGDAFTSSDLPFFRNFSTIPGFPLSKETLAEDARSVRTVSSINPRERDQGSAAFIRKLRREGLTKKFWMPDEAAKECRECLSVFSPLRRKHHCRICGQIFCSRCASNIISGARFGHDEMIRVCNFCLRMIEDYDDDRDTTADTASIAPSRPRTSSRPVISAPLEAQVRSPHAQFSASNLFSSSYPLEIESDVDGFDSVPVTPPDGSTTMGKPDGPAPFRRSLADEDRVPLELSETPDVREEGSPSPATESRGEHAVRPELNLEGASFNQIPFGAGDEPSSSVPFPKAEDAEEDGFDNLPNITPARSRLHSDARGGAFKRSRLRSRTSSRAAAFEELTAPPSLAEAAERARRDSRALGAASGEFELGPASMQHLRRMVRQALSRAGVSQAALWEDPLVNLLLQVARNVRPDVRGGDSIDIRRFVKIKRIPGGSVEQSEYVNGYVSSKNVASKRMARQIHHPRIMLLNFPLDYHRTDNPRLMSLDALLNQERSYLQSLVARIVALRPHLVLVEKQVSRLALDFLNDANVTVIKDVKASTIEAVARATQADIISSVDRLALEPRLGRCSSFSVQTYLYRMKGKGTKRRSFIRFEGCPRKSGCTLIIRGADSETLRRVKVVMHLLVFAVWNLKLEAHLMRDELTIMPPVSSLMCGAPAPSSPDQLQSRPSFPSLSATQHVLAERKINGVDVDCSLRPFEETILSASALVRTGPPHLLVRAREEEERLVEVTRKHEEEEAARILREESSFAASSSASVSDGDSIEAAGGSVRAAGANEASFASDATVVVDGSGPQFLPKDTASQAADDISQGPALSPASSVATITSKDGANSQPSVDLASVLFKPEDVDDGDDVATVAEQYTQHLKLWATERRKLPDIDPLDHQKLVVLASTVSAVTLRPCEGPLMKSFDFYGRGDETLGQYLEGLCDNAGKPCPSKTCDRPRALHFYNYVHEATRVQVITERFVCPLPGMEDRILMWSYCTICEIATTIVPMSEETWAYSFAKYLDLTFHPAGVCRTDICSHDVRREHVRYFAYRNLAVRFQSDNITILDVRVPPARLRVRADVRIKNDEYMWVSRKAAAYFDSVVARIKALGRERLEDEKARSLLADMTTRVENDRRTVNDALVKEYRRSSVTDTLSLTSVRLLLQEKVVQWDLDFADFEKTYLPAEKDIRRLTASHLKRLFVEKDSLVEKPIATPPASVPADEFSEKAETQTDGGDSVAGNEVTGTESTSPMLSRTDAGDISLSSTPSAAADRVESAPRPLRTCSEGNVLAQLASVRQSDADSITDGEVPGGSENLGKSPDSVAELVQRFGGPAAKSDLPSYRTLPRQPSPYGPSGSQSPRLRPKLSRSRTEEQRNGSKLGGSEQSDFLSESESQQSTSTLSKRREGRVRTPSSRIPVGAAARHRALTSVKDRRESNLRESSSERLDAPNSPSFMRSTSASRSMRATSPVPVRTRSHVKGSSTARGTVSKGKGPMSARASRAPHPPVSPSGAQSPVSKRTTSGRVSTIARHFDRLSREADRERVERHRQMMALRARRARPVTVTKAKVEVFEDLRDAVKEDSDEESDRLSSVGADDEGGGEDDQAGPVDASPKAKDGRTTSVFKGAQDERLEQVGVEGRPRPIGELQQIDHAASDTTGDMVVGSNLASGLSTPSLQNEGFATSSKMQTGTHLPEGELASSGTEKMSFLKTLSGFWAYRNMDFVPLEYPLLAGEHLWSDNPVIVREDEPSTIIAFTLSSKAYEDRLRNTHYKHTRISEQDEAFMPNETDDAQSTDGWGMVDFHDGADIEDALQRVGGTHFKYEFDSGSSYFSCKIFFAEQFDALRRKCGCERTFLESLAHCVKWDSAGGKSGSAFLKTKDNRLIIKQLSRSEMDTFSKFAPAYISYLSQAFSRDLPTTLAKIFGCFRIVCRNGHTGKQMRIDVVVMENLFYDRQISKIFDLKGSMRNRHVQSTGRENEVLLDENLVELAYQTPLFVRSHSKRILRASLHNDSLFLSNMNVMDYSLVAGIDASRNELVVGIVDFIRTYTWDKRVESIVKDSGLLGGGGKAEPTIVTPRQYKNRFRESMERYFVLTPDAWITPSVLVPGAIDAAEDPPLTYNNKSNDRNDKGPQ